MSRKPGSANITPVPVAAIAFVEEDIPTLHRASAENPFVAVVAPRAAAYLAGEPVKALSFAVPNANVEQTLRLLGLAGRANGVTVKKQVIPGDTDTTIKFWPAKMQTRPRKA